jgi:hypothetical protein
VFFLLRVSPEFREFGKKAGEIIFFPNREKAFKFANIDENPKTSKRNHHSKLLITNTVKIISYSGSMPYKFKLVLTVFSQFVLFVFMV